MVFSPYTAQDLESIILKRLGFNRFLVRPDVIKYASKRIANNSGDARLIIQTFHKAISDVLQTTEESELLKLYPENEVCDVIKIKQVHEAMNIESSWLEDRIDCLPTNAQMILAIICTLGETLDNWTEIPIVELKQYCFEAEEAGVFCFLTTQSFWYAMELLQDSALISVHDDLDNFYDDDEEMRFIKIGKERYDISCALKRVTAEHYRFFDRLAQYVKANPIE